jgi:hypothetical protein
LTLAEEARQTSQRDHTNWGISNSLRTKPVSFISAGTSEPLKLLEDLIVQPIRDGPGTDEATAESSQDKVAQPLPLPMASSPKSQQVEAEQESNPSKAARQHDPTTGLTTEDKSPADAPAEPLFFFDVRGEAPTESPAKVAAVPAQPPSCSSSDEEVILFKGRNPRPAQPKRDDFSLSQIHAEIQLVEEQILESEPALPIHNQRQRNRGSKRGKKVPRQDKSDEDALIADYIANMRENGETDGFLLHASYPGRDLGDMDTDIVLDLANGSDSENETTNPAPKTEKDLDKTKTNEGLRSDIDESGSELDEQTLEELLKGHKTHTTPGKAALNFDDLDSESSSDDDGPPRNELTNADDFDFMDWERPSLRRKRKGARAQVSFGAYDSEMEETLQMAWKNDRLKKSERKKQREERRALGLLGQTKPGDLRVKYPQGISLEEVGEEMKSFLRDRHETSVFSFIPGILPRLRTDSRQAHVPSHGQACAENTARNCNEV